MNVNFYPEPEMKFGNGQHIDIKFGLMNYGPLDFQSLTSPKKINLGIIGTNETIEGIERWIDKIRIGIAAKASKRPNLFPRFPGFGEGMNLCADFICGDQLRRPIPQRDFDRLCQKSPTDENLKKIAELFLNEMGFLSEKNVADVYIFAYPFVLTQYLARTEEDFTFSEVEDPEDPEQIVQTIHSKINLHDYLKAQAMRYKKPTQIIRPSTYDERKRLKRKHPSGDARKLQDEATRAWNLYIALYYKAGGIPWRLIREWSQLTTCYVGVSFYKTTDEEKLLTSTAQVFNERGEGVILRGGTGKISKEDKQIHLSSDDAKSLLKNALQNYHREHKTFPARVVIHKSSIHNQNEIDGFEDALHECSIDPSQADFISLTRSYTRLYRGNIYPPLRGTFLDTGGKMYILYTKGSVDFYEAYPGMYIPLPLGFRCDQACDTPEFIAQEILGLTKMNWNNSQFDGSEPITLRASRQVGSILKYLDQDYEPYYRYYM